ncbi:hypothetical protein N7447_004019 [Penicillium robsamsonii]|uniref:uncharacterized protein n=1 Tax=Penicillium robsamsonii TaxID=1792511 RepID=UPI002549BD40|nr:uncharacterized protein N7447_004019 [Penicillium robsamsonii]KAJ5827256.1 hypothetical protein N7447_004019 [Penicillium robsamsonii]
MNQTHLVTSFTIRSNQQRDLIINPTKAHHTELKIQHTNMLPLCQNDDDNAEMDMITSPHSNNSETQNVHYEAPTRSATDRDHEPGFWARMTQTNGWLTAERESVKPGTLLNAIVEQEVVREPVLTKHWTGLQFFQAVD